MSADHGPGVRIPPPVMVAALLGGAWLLMRALPLPIARPLPMAGAGVIGVAVLLAVWAVVVMLRAGTDPRPDKPDAAIVESGPFGLTRNPIYLGFVIAAAGFALRWGDLWGWAAAAASALVLDRLVIAREEAYLAARFGAAYDAYKGRVRRWI